MTDPAVAPDEDDAASPMRRRQKAMWAAIFLVPIGAWWLYLQLVRSWVPEERQGIFGDMFGGFNALFTGISLLVVALSLRLQAQQVNQGRKEFAMQRREHMEAVRLQEKGLEAQRQELALQREELSRQLEEQIESRRYRSEPILVPRLHKIDPHPTDGSVQYTFHVRNRGTGPAWEALLQFVGMDDAGHSRVFNRRISIITPSEEAPRLIELLHRAEEPAWTIHYILVRVMYYNLTGGCFETISALRVVGHTEGTHGSNMLFRTFAGESVVQGPIDNASLIRLLSDCVEARKSPNVLRAMAQILPVGSPMERDDDEDDDSDEDDVRWDA